MEKLFEDETLEDLQRDSLVIIQKKTGFRFGTDAVLLSDFAAGAKGRALDLCTGTGIVAVLLCAKSEAREIHALEIQPVFADMARRSAELNGLEEKLHITCGDLKEAHSFYPLHSFDAVTCNPPYMQSGANLKNSTDALTVARHEVMCTLEDVVRAAADMLKFHGKFFLVHRPSRIADIFKAFEECRIAPKRMRLVYPSVGKAPVMVLMEGSYMGGRELKVMPPLILYDENGNESVELGDIYGRTKG